MNSSRRIAVFTFFLGLMAALAYLAYFHQPGDADHDRPRLEILEFVEQGRHGEVARRLADVYAGIGPGGAGDRELLLQMYAFSSSNPELLPALEAWVDAEPESTIAHLALGMHLRHLSHLSRGRELVGSTSTGQFAGMYDYAEKAAFHYRKAVELDASNSLAWAFLANLPSSMRTADTTWNRVLAEHAPLSESAWYQALFKAQPKWGGSIFRLQELLATLEERIADNPRLASLRGFDQFAIADEHFYDGNYQAARASCERAMKAGSHSRFRDMCAMAYRRLEDYPTALQLIDEALEDSPEDTGFFEERARILRKMNRMDEALAMLDSALRYDSLDPSTLQSKARYLLELNRLDEALEALETARVYGDNDTDLHTLASRVNYNAGYYEQAAASARRAAELAPDESFPLMRLAMAYNKLFDCPNLHDAAAAYVASCETRGDCSKTNHDWAEQVLEVMQTHPACAEWQKAREANSSTS